MMQPFNQISLVDKEKKINFEKSVRANLDSYIKRFVKNDIGRKETFIEIQKKITNIQNYEFVSNHFKDIIQNKSKVLLYCDYDNDGLSAGTEMTSFLKMFGVPYEVVFPGRKEDGYGLKVANLSGNERVRDFIEKAENTGEKVYICSLDNGINNDEVNNLLKAKGITYLSIDHHQPEDGFHNSYCMNPHLNKENISVEENLCTGMLVFGFCLSMFDKIGGNNSEMREMKKEFLMNNFDLAILSTLSDYMKLDGINRAIVRNFQEDMLSRARLPIRRLIEVNSDFMQRSKIYETLNFNVISLLNAVGRMKHMDMAYKFLTEDAESPDVYDILSINEEKKGIVNEACKDIISRKDEIVGDSNTLIYTSEAIEGGIASIISTRMAMSLGKVTMIGHTDSNNKIRFSIRSPFYNHMLKTEFAKMGYHYKGHNVAGVVEIDVSEFEEFVKKSKEHFSSIDSKVEKDEILETITDASVLSVGLIDMIYSYGPYGAGVKEPVFRALGTFERGSNGRLVGTSTSGKMQVLQMKIGDKVFRVNNKTGADLKDSDVEGKTNIIIRLGYPYPNQNKINLELVSLEGEKDYA